MPRQPIVTGPGGDTKAEGTEKIEQQFDELYERTDDLETDLADLVTDQATALSAAVSTLNTEDDALQTQIDGLQGVPAPVQALSTGGTLVLHATAEVHPITLTGNVTGIIIPAATRGRKITLIIRSAFTIAFAAEATSRVVDGSGITLAAKRHHQFYWDGDFAGAGVGRWVNW